MPDLLPDLIGKFLSASDIQQDWRQDKLHVSSDLVGCARRACLEMSTADQEPTDAYGATRRLIGKGLHNWLQKNLGNNFDVLVEKNIEEGLPDGWTGSTDIVLMSSENDECVVYDLKIASATQKYFADLQINKPGYSSKANTFPSEDHVWQVSAYVYALREMGYNVVSGRVCYWFIDSFHDRRGGKYQYDPVEFEVELVDKESLEERMAQVSREVNAWKKSSYLPQYMPPEHILKSARKERRPTRYKVIQKLDWRCKYCPFYQRACNPDHKESEIGEWFYDVVEAKWAYNPFDGFEDIEPLVKPPGYFE